MHSSGSWPLDGENKADSGAFASFDKGGECADRATTGAVLAAFLPSTSHFEPIDQDSHW